MDLFVTLTIVLSFAALLTAHVALVAGLVARKPWWRAPLAFVVVPLAPYWGFRERMRARAAIWATALAIYAITLVVARSFAG
jgi:hypothetical protein